MPKKLPPKRETSKPGRLALAGAVVRVVMPTADDLTPAQRAKAAEYGTDLDRYAKLAAALAQGRVPVRRADESDEALTLRERHFAALGLARELVLELEALAPTADGATGATDEDRWELAERIASVEAARAAWLRGRPHVRGGGLGEAARRIGAVRDALEHARRWGEKYAAGESGIPVDVDCIRAEAFRTSPELASIPAADWKRAIDAWPGIARRGDGRARRYGDRLATWHGVVFSLLEPHGLTDAKSSKALAATHEKGAAARPRAKDRRR